MDKVLVCLKIFNSFRSAFREFKGKLHTYFVGDKKPKLWEFQEQLIFKRFDSFVDRLDIVKEFFRTAQQFLKLEKVEIGGIRGRALSSRIGSVHEEFKVTSFTSFPLNVSPYIIQKMFSKKSCTSIKLLGALWSIRKPNV